MFHRPAKKYHHQQSNKKKNKISLWLWNRITNHMANFFQEEGQEGWKEPTHFYQKTLDPISTQVIDLAQESDEENTKVKNKLEKRDPDFDHVKHFFP